MRIGITGTTGLFGYGLLQTVEKKSHEAVPLPHAQLEITDALAVERTLRDAALDLLIHPAGIPDIDLCETDHEKCRRANVEGTRNLCAAAGKFGFGLAFISTDAVFDGKKTSPYTESDATRPISYYGESKVAAERIAQSLSKYWIFRVSVLFGPGKTNFVEKTINQLRKGEKYVVAADQMGSATYTLDAAEKILEVASAAPSGVYHLSNQGACSRYELAIETARIAGLDESNVLGHPMNEMRRPGPRLKYSVMEMDALAKAGIAPPRDWKKALAEYLNSYLLR